MAEVVDFAAGVLKSAEHSLGHQIRLSNVVMFVVQSTKAVTVRWWT